MNLLDGSERISVTELKKMVSENIPLLVIDVRKNNEFEMCHLPFSINVQLNDLNTDVFKSEVFNRVISGYEKIPNC